MKHNQNDNKNASVATTAAEGARAVWTYTVCFLDASGNFVGRESTVDVAVQGRSHQMK